MTILEKLSGRISRRESDMERLVAARQRRDALLADLASLNATKRDALVDGTEAEVTALKADISAKASELDDLHVIVSTLEDRRRHAEKEARLSQLRQEVSDYDVEVEEVAAFWRERYPLLATEIAQHAKRERALNDRRPSIVGHLQEAQSEMPEARGLSFPTSVGDRLGIAGGLTERVRLPALGGPVPYWPSNGR